MKSDKVSDLYSKCLELSLDWDSTEEIVQGCVDLVSKEKDAEIERLRKNNRDSRRAYTACLEERKIKDDLLLRAADAIHEHCIDGFWDCNELLKELRKAVECRKLTQSPSGSLGGAHHKKSCILRPPLDA